MPVEKLPDGRFRVRLRYGAGLRDRFIIVAKDEPAALVKARRMQRMANQLAASGKHAEAKAVLEEAGLAETQQDMLDVESVVRDLCAEAAVADASAPAGSKTPTFNKVADLYFDEQLRRGNSPRTVSRDRQRLARVAGTLMTTRVNQVTKAMADAAMATLPESAGTSRFLFEGAIYRVLKHAEKLELIDQMPLRADWVSKQLDPKKLFQYLRADEERKLITGRAPLWRRIGYAIMSREGVRPEFLTHFYWSDRVDPQAVVSTIDLDSGLLTHRHKQKKVRRWPVCERVLRVLRAWREVNDEDRVLPLWEHGKIARTLRSDLADAGVSRKALHRTTATERQITAKDAGRATFVTLALRAGAPMHWVTDRTGHMSESVVARYNRMARESRDTVRVWLHPLDEALAADLGLEPVTDRYVVPWLQGLQGAEVTQALTVGALGQQVGQLLELIRSNAPLGGLLLTSTDSPLEASAPPQEAKTAPPSASSTTAQTPGPAGFVALGQPGPGDPVELALAAALEAATRSERWDVVLAVTAELRERRLARVAPDVTSLQTARKRRDEGGGK